MNICNCGDFVKITLNDFDGLPQRIIVGLVLEVKPGFNVGLSKLLRAKHNREIKLITISGDIWRSWVDVRDEVEIITNYATQEELMQTTIRA